MLIDAARQLVPQEFSWLQPPYEYEEVKPPIDILFGNDQLRKYLTSDGSIEPDVLTDLLSYSTEAWRDRISPHLIYDDRAGRPALC